MENSSRGSGFNVLLLPQGHKAWSSSSLGSCRSCWFCMATETGLWHHTLSYRSFTLCTVPAAATKCDRCPPVHAHCCGDSFFPHLFSLMFCFLGTPIIPLSRRQLLCLKKFAKAIALAGVKGTDCTKGFIV